MAVSDYDPIINAASQEWDVDPNWVRSVMQQESGGHPLGKDGKPIRSSAGAGGLMQIMPGTATGLGVSNVDDPVQNIWGGVKYLSQMRDQFHGDVPLATAAYNAGPDRVSAYLNDGTPLPSQTVSYLPAVASHYQRYAARTPQGTVPSTGQSPVATSPSIALPSPATAKPGAMSDDDFLKRVGGTQAPAAPTSTVLSDDDFLKRAASGGNVPTYKTAPPVDLTQGEGANPYDNPMTPLPPGAGQGLAAVGKAALQGGVSGAVAGWQNTPDILTPAAANWLGEHVAPSLASTGLPSYALKAGGAVLGALHAIPAAIAEAGNQLGDHPVVPMGLGNFPLLGRDLAGMAENPLSTMGAGVGTAPAPRYGATEGGVAVPLSQNARIAARLDQVREGNPLISSTPNAAALEASPVASGFGAPVTVARTFGERSAVPAEGVSSPLVSTSPGPVAAAPAGAPAPRSVGAAAAGVRGVDFPNMTPAEELASRSTGEMQRVLDPAKPGIDTTIYVPGTKPTEAEVSGSPNVAAEQKFNRSQNSDPHIEREQANNAARVEYYDQTAGTPTQVQRMVEERGAQADKDLKAAFGNKQPADAQPVVDTINGILSDPRLGERDLVRKYISPYLGKLTNEDGSLKTDPEALYGIRENITDQLSKAGKAETPGVAQASRQLMQLKASLDDAIESGAPGYRQYLTNFSDASRPIDAMEYLQDARPSLTNAQGTMAPAAFDRFMKNTVTDRASGGIHPATSLTEDQMDALHNIHSDLKRFQNINLSNPRGSDTNMMGQIAGAGGRLIAHGAANYVAPVLGSIGVKMAENALQSRRTAKMTDRVLNPNPLKYPPSQEP